MNAPQAAHACDDLRDLLVRRLVRGDLVLPPLSEIGQQVLAMVKDEASSAETLSNLVKRDAGLASALVRYSNSASLGGSVPVVSLAQAISRLGMGRVAELAFTVSMQTGISGGTRYQNLFSTYWRRSLATGLFAKEIAREMRSNVEVAFLCGLLRGVGPPLVLHALCELSSARKLPNEGEAAELARTLAPAFVGAAVVSWKLPETVAAGLELSTAPAERCDEAWIGALAERLADHSLSEGDPREPRAFGRDEDADALNLYPEMLDRLVALASSIREEVDAL